MSQFTTDLKFKKTTDSRGGRPLYVLTQDLKYYSDLLGRLVVVREGFITDFASIPWPFRVFLSPRGPWKRAATVHDWLYRSNVKEEVSRAEADDVFREAMKADGVDLVTRNLFWAWVRVF